jgi:dTDP-4-amino-4,6-dideoxygalactose transaminase
MIPFEDLERVNRPFHREFRQALNGVLRSGRYILGGQVDAFEEELASWLGAAHAVGVGSGYDALTLSFMALGLTRGEVIVPANTYLATVLAVRRCGLTPVLVEPDPASLLLDPAAAARGITRRTVAILPVHLYGLACDMERLTDLAVSRGLALVEDCAQAQGASFRGRQVGTFGNTGAFSFYPTKNLGGLGDGGAVVTGDPAVAERVRRLRNYGCPRRGVAAETGLNSRLDEIQAAFLRRKLPALHDLVRRKNLLAERYDRGLSPAIRRPRAPVGAACARHLYPVLHPRRDDLRAALAGAGIATEIHYPVPPHRQPAIAPHVRGQFPLSDQIHRSILSLPLSAGHREGEIDRVITAVNHFQESC